MRAEKPVVGYCPTGLNRQNTHLEGSNVILRAALALIGLITNVGAWAQAPAPFPPQPARSVSVEWDILPKGLQQCMEQQLRQERGTNIGALVTQSIPPSSPLIKDMMDRCSNSGSSTSSTGPSFGGPDSASRDFANWVNVAMLTKPSFSKAFAQCREVVSLYQNQILKRLRGAEAAATSKTDQQGMRDVMMSLNAKRDLVTKAACLKQFIASLGIAGSQTTYYADELSMLEGKFRDNRFNLKDRAAARVDDLTEQGFNQLSLRTSLGHLDLRELQAEIDSVMQYPSGAGYLACLVTNEWVSWFSSNSFCHGPLMEGKMIEIASLL
jgi:hypothetical protein